MTKMPAVSNWSKGQNVAWDAWNRPVKITQKGVKLDAYQYDGLSRRIAKQTREGNRKLTRHYYYSNQWQVLEERTGTSATADTQYVWGIRYQDDIVLRDRLGGTSDRVYALADYFQPTAVADKSGTIKERYVYRAFGDVSYYDNAFQPAKPAFNWTYLYGSYQFDPKSALYQVRNRYYHCALGRWLSRDPLKKAEQRQGTNLYWYTTNNAVNNVDPYGLITCFDRCDTAYNSVSNDIVARYTAAHEALDAIENWAKSLVAAGATYLDSYCNKLTDAAFRDLCLRAVTLGQATVDGIIDIPFEALNIELIASEALATASARLWWVGCYALCAACKLALPPKIKIETPKGIPKGFLNLS